MFQEHKILNAEDLFKYRLPRDKSVPQKGGAKDYTPDGTWLQAKQLEAFHQERKAVLSEQRVEKIGSLVRGEWKPEAGLVEFHKEMGKFWGHMGFVDSSRKWLYPEEALYLMETLVFEVFYKGVALSIQEAYSLFLKASLELEEYQVYAHLRRLGYVVLRHRGKSDVTSYERKIKLDKHVKRSKLRKRKMDDVETFTSEAEGEQQDLNSAESEKKCSKLQHNQAASEHQTANDNQEMDVEESMCREDGTEMTGDSYVPVQHNRKMSSLLNSENDIKRQDDRLNENVLNIKDSHSSEIKPNNHTKIKNVSYDIHPVDSQSSTKTQKTDIKNVWDNVHIKDLELLKDKPVRRCKWNFDDIDFPDIGNKDRVILKIPSKKLLPPNVEVSEEFDDQCIFDVLEYRRISSCNYGNSADRKQNDYLENLHFSYSDWMQSRNKIQASNWTEYKKNVREKMALNVQETPVGHLWEGEVTPLVRPEDATSTANILNKLSVIKSFKPEKLNLATLVKISFDVFLPDAKFKKSSPGLPNHRICVARSSDSPPCLADLTMMKQQLGDDVPVHWAVVDNGEIAFYSFSNFSLPVDISMG